MNFLCVCTILSLVSVSAVLSRNLPPSEDLSTASLDDLDTLELVQILYRHGDRTPLYLYKDDEHADYWNAQGLGQLTNIGKEEHYDLGAFIRQRYSGFLNDTYDANEVVIRSTDVDRTLMSAESNLAGLYPPKGDQVWDRNIYWQPIPVHTVPRSADYLMSMSPCPKYDEAFFEMMNSSEVRQINEENRDFYEFLNNSSGWEINNICRSALLSDVLLVEKTHNFTLPSWSNETVYDRLRYLSTMCFVYSFYSPEELRLGGGSLVKEMLANANAKATGEIDQRRAFIYSAHDTTISGVMSVLGVYNSMIVPYTSALFVELHRPATFGYPYTVRIFYRNSTSVEPYELTVPHCAPTCGMLCPLYRLAQIVGHLLPDDIVSECNSDVPPTTTFASASKPLVLKDNHLRHMRIDSDLLV